MKKNKKIIIKNSPNEIWYLQFVPFCTSLREIKDDKEIKYLGRNIFLFLMNLDYSFEQGHQPQL